MTEYYCGICKQEITGEDIDERHTLPNGEDCHEDCCHRCGSGIRGLVMDYMPSFYKVMFDETRREHE